MAKSTVSYFCARLVCVSDCADEFTTDISVLVAVVSSATDPLGARIS